MIAVSFRFLSGRYHATPWDHHVNEGAVEWPPAPWRILRALVAVWKRTLPDLSRERTEPIFRALLESPEFSLPPASTGHTRHFMPWDKNWKPEKQHPRTLVYDTFVAVGREWDENGRRWDPAPVVASWPNADITNSQRETLALLLGNLNTLGRSESWCEAELVNYTENPSTLRCFPLEGEPSSAHEIVRLLCPDPASALADDHVVTVKSKTTGRGKNRQTVEERSTVYDPAWNLCMETLQLHRERWSDPPGSRRVAYARPKDCFKVSPRPGPLHAAAAPVINISRFAFDSTVLPLVTETLPVAEAARRYLMGIHGRITQINGKRGMSPVFSGKDADGGRLDGHRHAYYLPTDEDGDGRLDHLTVYAAGGFGPDERLALDRLRNLRTGRKGEESHPLRLLLLGMGVSDEYQPGPLVESREWISVTPYIASRYARTEGRNRIDLRSQEACAVFLQEDLRTILTTVRPDIADLIEDIEPLWDENRVFKISERWRPIQFKRYRRKASDDGGRRLAGAFRLTFRRPVRGPIALGWSSHFGMGLFMPQSKHD